MNNVYILQNEIKNLVDKFGDELNATDEEKTMALYMALATAYEVQVTRAAYIHLEAAKAKTVVQSEEDSQNGNTDAER